MKQPRTPESVVLRACLDYLAVIGVKAWRNNKGAGKFRNKKGGERFLRFGGPDGASDIIGYCRSNGRAVFIETKASDGTASDEQRKFIAEANAAGCFAAIVRSLDELIAEAKAQGVTNK